MKKYKFKLLMERVFFMEGKNVEEARYKLLEKMAEERPTFESIGMDYLDDGIEVITKD